MIAEAPATCSGHCEVHCRPPVVWVGGVAIDIANVSVRIDGRLLRPDIETRILVYLAERIGRLCRPDDIIRAAWQATWAVGEEDRHNLRVAVYRLRKALGPAARSIQSYPGFGYVLVRELDAEAPAAGPSFAPLQARLLRQLGAAPGRRASLARLAAEAGTRGCAGWRRASARKALRRLAAHGFSLAVEPGPPPEWGYVTLLAEDGAP